MPIVVPCPGCPAQLSAPESAAGKQIRCPRCKTIATVPGFVPAEEVPVVEAAVAPRPKVKPAVVDDEDDDRPRRTRPRRGEEEDDDERPRPTRSRRARDDDERPRRKKRKAAGGGGAIALVVVGGLLLLAGVGAGIYLLVGKGGLLARKAPVPPGWKQYDYPQSGFKAAFPSEPSVFGTNIQGGVGGLLPGGVEVPQLESMHSYTTGGHSGTSVTVDVHRYRAPIPRASRDLMGRDGNNRFAGGSVKRVRWLGGDALETAAGGTVIRMVALEKVVVFAVIAGPNGARARPEEEKGFFDSFELTK